MGICCVLVLLLQKTLIYYRIVDTNRNILLIIWNSEFWFIVVADVEDSTSY